MDHEATRAITEPPRCMRCDRDALTVNDAGTALCARHATIFTTIERLKAVDTTEKNHLAPA